MQEPRKYVICTSISLPYIFDVYLLSVAIYYRNLLLYDTYHLLDIVLLIRYRCTCLTTTKLLSLKQCLTFLQTLSSIGGYHEMIVRFLREGFIGMKSNLKMIINYSVFQNMHPRRGSQSVERRLRVAPIDNTDYWIISAYISKYIFLHLNRCQWQL